MSGLWLLTRMPGVSHRGQLPELSFEEREISAHLETHVRALADEIGERNIWKHSSMKASAQYIEGVLTGLNYAVHRQEFPSHGVTSHNLEVTIAGAARPDESIVIGAHYDTVAGCPGANDNASGVAAILELARLLKNITPDRTIRIVAFANEEPPFFTTGTMGSLHYARNAKQQRENIRAMLSLETMGYYSDRPGSQQYPFPFSLFYPESGNFIGFVGNIRSLRLVRKTVGSFRNHVAFPAEGLAAPSFVTGVGWSDHWSFWQQGYPAIMVTDTAFYRYGAYHTPYDTCEKVNYERLARVVGGLVPTLLDLAAVQ